MKQTDFLVIGSGIAGLTFALKTALRFPAKEVTIVTKTKAIESNTRYAQGGIAVVSDIGSDSFEEHISDTLRAGDGLCDEQVVEMVIRQGPERLKELIEWGTRFDRSPLQSYHLGKEGGHSANRILHRGDATGLEIEKTLLNRIKAQRNIRILQHHLAVDLITENNNCYGVIVLNTKTEKRLSLRSKFTLLAAGGAGQVYSNTTNPVVATGDGIAMAARAKAATADMEFVQFHPTALYEPNRSPSFLISEAVRGTGAILRTISGEAFMHRYDPRKDLASRDIVSRAIFTELKSSGDKYVLLDCRHINKDSFQLHFPNIFRKCSELGIDVSEDMIPVVPAAHYLCGGIVVDDRGRTSINRLYACGECSRTGLHGANRLASNSLLEAIVYAHRSFEDVSNRTNDLGIDDIESADPLLTPAIPPTSDPKILRLRIQQTMSALVGIERRNDELRKAAELVDQIAADLLRPEYFNPNSPEWHETRNLADTAALIIRQSLLRTENRGTFFNRDLEPVSPSTSQIPVGSIA